MAVPLLKRLLVPLLAAAFPTAAALARELPLFAPQHDFLLLDPKEPGDGSQPPAYDSTGPGARWNIAQWNIPAGRLPPFTREQDGDRTVFTSIARHSAVEIARGPEGTRIRLRQDGSVLPCEIAGGQPRESDLFFQVNGGPMVPDGRSGLLRDGAENPPLSRMTALTQRVTVEVDHEVTAEPSGCQVNQASAIVALVLKNASANQTLFYQLQLAPFCGRGAPERLQICEARPGDYVAFSKSQPFGVDDYLRLLGEPPLREGEPRQIAVDLLPRILHVLRTGPEGLDRDPAHWVVGGLYAGQLLWGGVVTRSNWRDFSLTATVP